jgi:sphingomyelin phosphodiesterase
VDQLEIAYSDYSSDYTLRTANDAIEVSYICPSMTPTSGPPAFRVYSVDPVTFGVLDIETYIANISDPSYQISPVWQKYYSAKEIYGPLVTPPLTDPTAELTPEFWHNVTAAFINDDTAFQGYIARQTRGFDVSDCTGTCKSSEICGIRAAESQYNCGTITPGISFKKRDEFAERSLGTVEVGECEGSQARPIIAKIVAQQGMLEEAARRAVEKYGRK